MLAHWNNKQYTDRYVALLWSIILILSQTVFAVFSSLMLYAWRRSSTYYYSLWFDLTMARTHDLLHFKKHANYRKSGYFGVG